MCSLGIGVVYFACPGFFTQPYAVFWKKQDRIYEASKSCQMCNFILCHNCNLVCYLQFDDNVGWYCPIL